MQSPRLEATPGYKNCRADRSVNAYRPAVEAGRLLLQVLCRQQFSSTSSLISGRGYCNAFWFMCCDALNAEFGICS